MLIFLCIMSGKGVDDIFDNKKEISADEAEFEKLRKKLGK